MHHATERPRVTRFQANRELALRRGYGIIFGMIVVVVSATGMKFVLLGILMAGRVRPATPVSEFAVFFAEACHYLLVASGAILLVGLWRKAPWRRAALGAWAAAVIITAVALLGPYVVSSPLAVVVGILVALFLTVLLCRWFSELDAPVT
jgi:hypothetical protein